MVRRTICLPLLLTFLWVAKAEAQADAPVSEEPAGEVEATGSTEVDAAAKKKQAEQRFLGGLQLARAESWDAALAEFLASRELYPTRVALRNAAMCLEQLHRYADAIEMTEELLSTFGDSLPAEERMASADAIERLRSHTATLSVTADQSGASVVVDSRQRGVTPLQAPIVVDAGTHVVRVFKEGYGAFDAEVVVAGKQSKTVSARLAALEQSGKLRVQEAAGKTLDVVIDGVSVGKTPWTGSLSVGVHTVFLRGPEDMGTPPSSATVFSNRLSTLTLGAARMDSQLRVEPTPSNARVDIDGVPVGNGVWEGKLKSGKHRVEVAAEGFVAYRKDAMLASGARESLRIELERDLTNPMWRDEVFQPHIYAELFGGVAWSPSFGGSADSACSGDACSGRSRPFGPIGGARGGYQLTSGLGLEVFVAYLRIAESMTRTQSAAAELQLQLSSDNYRDETVLAGPAFGASASYQFLRSTPIRVRVWAGAMRASADFDNAGTFRGRTTYGTPPTEQDFQVEFSVEEQTKKIWVPLVGPEVRMGYQFSKSFSLDAGVALLIAFPQSITREGRTSVSSGDRAGELPDLAGGVRPGVARLPGETGFGTFFAVVPTLGGRFDF